MMELEIVTTKRRITKSIITQMPEATMEDMKTGNPLGYILNVVKGEYKVLLLDNHTLVYLGWKKEPDAIWRKLAHKKTWYRQTKKVKDVTDWWMNYVNVLRRVDNLPQIFI
jgi:hypothetical protein